MTGRTRGTHESSACSTAVTLSGSPVGRTCSSRHSTWTASNARPHHSTGASLLRQHRSHPPRPRTPCRYPARLDERESHLRRTRRDGRRPQHAPPPRPTRTRPSSPRQGPVSRARRSLASECWCQGWLLGGDASRGPNARRRSGPRTARRELRSSPALSREPAWSFGVTEGETHLVRWLQESRFGGVGQCTPVAHTAGIGAILRPSG